MNEKNPAKWLRYLMYVHLGSIANSMIGFLPIPGQLTLWISRLISVAAIFCLLKLQPFSAHYRKAAGFRVLMLGCVLINVFVSVIPAVIGSVFSFIAVYQEYSGHGELAAPMDPGLSQKWHSFFLWSIAATLLVSLVSSAVAILILAADMDSAVTQNVIMSILDAVQLAVDGFYLWYLIRTIRLFEPES